MKIAAGLLKVAMLLDHFNRDVVRASRMDLVLHRDRMN
jgi:hypothetical protein